MKGQLDSKRSEAAKLNMKVDMVHMEMETIKKALEESNQALEHEKTLLASVQSDLKEAETNGVELSSHLSKLEEHIQSLTSSNNGLNSELEDAKITITQQSEQLDSVQQKLQKAIRKEKEELCKNEYLRQSHQEEMQRVAQEKQVSGSNLQKLNGVLNTTQDKLGSVQSDLEKVRLELTKKQEQSTSLQLSLETETASRNELAKRYTALEAKHEESLLLLQDSNGKAGLMKKENNELKGLLEVSKNHCAALQRELKEKEELKAKGEEQMADKLSTVISQYEKETSDCKNINDAVRKLD